MTTTNNYPQTTSINRRNRFVTFTEVQPWHQEIADKLNGRTIVKGDKVLVQLDLDDAKAIEFINGYYVHEGRRKEALQGRLYDAAERFAKCADRIVANTKSWYRDILGEDVESFDIVFTDFPLKTLSLVFSEGSNETTSRGSDDN